MPSKGVTRQVALASAPQRAEHAKVAVHLPATFDPEAPARLCLFLHGRGGDVPFETHIAQAIDQIEGCASNVVLVAPRFGDGAQPGTFQDGAGFSSFFSELQSHLPALADAPIVLAAFSGGWRPLGAVLKGLRSPANPLAGRVAGILLLDCIYGLQSSAEVIAWQKARRAQTALLSIYGRDTADDAPAANRALIEALRRYGPVHTTARESFAPGSVTFLEVATPHLDIVSDGPPVNPIADFLDRLSV
jgi:hypothetical protein